MFRVRNRPFVILTHFEMFGLTTQLSKLEENFANDLHTVHTQVGVYFKLVYGNSGKWSRPNVDKHVNCLLHICFRIWT